MVKPLQLNDGDTVVELGAGTGTVTHALRQRIEHLQRDVRLVAFELNPKFCEHLRREFPGLELGEGDAASFAERLRDEFGVKEAAHIVSGLPMPSLPKSAQQNVLRSTQEILHPQEGVFQQLAFFPWVYKRFYERLFNEVDFHFVFPQGYYTCKTPKVS